MNFVRLQNDMMAGMADALSEEVAVRAAMFAFESTDGSFEERMRAALGAAPLAMLKDEGTKPIDVPVDFATWGKTRIRDTFGDRVFLRSSDSVATCEGLWSGKLAR